MLLAEFHVGFRVLSFISASFGGGHACEKLLVTCAAVFIGVSTK